MIIRKITLAIIISIISITAFSAEKTGFDEICKIYTEAKNSSMTKEELSTYIFENIKNRVKSKDALEAHEAVFNLGTDKRFSVFKQSAEYSLKHKWECVAVEELMK